MSNLKDMVSKDFMEAFKARDMDKKNFLGVVKGEIQLQEGRGIDARWKCFKSSKENRKILKTN